MNDTKNLTKQRVFIISDTHFDHRNVIDYCNRPFNNETPEEMNEALIRNWNEQVNPDDIVIHCGDFSLTSHSSVKSATKRVVPFKDRLNGHIILVLGNHDGVRLPWREWGFSDVYLNKLTVGHNLFCHDLTLVDKDEKAAATAIYYGHVHNTPFDPQVEPRQTATCVSVEMIDYRPLDITSKLTAEEISDLEKLTKK